MSPISTMSTVSSVSSTSSSGSSSRASLRSASIVSSCTIPLDEEDEETGNHDLTSVSATLVTSGQHTTPQPLASSQGTILSRKMNKLPEETQCELLAQQLLDMLSTNVANNSGTSGSTANNSVLDEAAYKKLVSLIGKKILLSSHALQDAGHDSGTPALLHSVQNSRFFVQKTFI